MCAWAWWSKAGLLFVPTLHRSVIELTQRLADTLSASSTSMSSTADLTSAAGKAAWWQQRVALDTSMKQLLQDLGSDWLGPWRCLLLPRPPGQEAASAAASAAGELVEEQFGAVLGESPPRLCTEMCLSPVCHLGPACLPSCQVHMLQHGIYTQPLGQPKVTTATHREANLSPNQPCLDCGACRGYLPGAPDPAGGSPATSHGRHGP